MSSLLHLLQHIRLALLDDVIKLLFALELVHLQLTLEFFLLFDFLLGSLEITLEVKEEIRLLNKLKTFLEFIVLLHQIYNGFVRNLDLTLSNCSSDSLDSDWLWRVFASLPADATGCLV